VNLLLWFLLLVIQNAAFTWVSRARNSGSYGYHAIAAVFSNGIWFVSQFILIGMVVKPDMPLSRTDHLRGDVLHRDGNVVEPRHFFRKNLSAHDLFKLVEQDEDVILDDASSECGESCELYPMEKL